MAKYKVGDKVRIVSKAPSEHWNPRMDKWLGRVMTIRKDEADIVTGKHFAYKMEEDKCEGRNRGWYWWDDMIAGLVSPGRSSLVVEIQFDGNTTRATLIKDGREVKTAEARCNPSDTFDRGEGAKVAVNRLFAKKQKPKKEEPKKKPKGDAWEKAHLFIVTGDCHPTGHFFPIGEKVLRIMGSSFPGVSKYVSLRTGLVQSVSDHDVKPVGKER